MKLFFSLFILINLNHPHLSNCLASKIVIYHQAQTKVDAKIIEEIFNKKYEIPKSLIVLKEKSCDKGAIDKRFLYLCIKKKGELLTLSSNINFKIKSLLAFRSL